MADPDLAFLQNRAEALIAAARKAGADAADTIVASGRSLSVDVRDRRLEENGRAEGDVLGLRVFAGQRQAIVSTSDVDPAGFAALAERAVAMARVAPEDAFAGLAPRERLATDLPDYDLHDGTERDAATLEEMARAAEAAALDVAGVTKSGGASAGQSHNGAVLVTSDGFSGAYRRSSFWVAATAIAGDGTAMQRDYDHTARLHAADLDAPEKVGRTAGERAVAALQPRKIETRRAHVIFDRRVAGGLVGHLLGAANGAAVARGTSFLRHRMGERLFRPGISVVDDPTRQRGLSSRPFDDEGVASRPLAVVEDGFLRSWLLDSATARELGLETTGHAQRGAGSAPSPGASNVVLAAGSRSPAALMRDCGEGLLVTQLIGSAVNLVTGDYSRGCFGFWFENGAVAYPVAEITLAGHLDAIFAAMEPADDLELRRGIDAPTTYAGELMLAGR